jgi:hypothetical protein
MLGIFGLMACGSEIQDLYQSEKQLVLEKAPPLSSSDWKEDIIVSIKYEPLSELAEKMVQEELKGAKLEKSVLGMNFVLRPKAQISSFELLDAPNKKNHILKYKCELDGNATWKSAAMDGSLPYSIVLNGTIAINSDGRSAHLSVESLDGLEVKLEGSTPLNVTPLLKKWLKETMTNLPKITIYELEKRDPIRGMRFQTDADAFNVQLISDVVHSQSLKKSPPADTDWSIQMSEAVVIGLIRREAFKEGVISHGIAVDPRSLSVSKDSFDLGLRLWKIEGFGGSWWRDYQATGTIEYKSGRERVRFKADEVTEGDKSKGAGLADPLALLGKGILLSTIEENLTIAIPQKIQWKVGDTSLEPKVKEILAIPNGLRISGNFSVNEGLQNK